MKPTSWTLALAAGVAAAALALGQEEELGDSGLGAAPTEGRAFVAQAVEAMGGEEALRRVRAAALAIDPGGGPIRERHTLVLRDRRLHYASRREGGAGFDVVLAPGLFFLCDRDPRGEAAYVEDLTEEDAVEGCYERDILFMPLLLGHLLADPEARLDYRGPNSEGDHVVRALVRPSGGGPGAPFVIRLLFDKETRLLEQAMGIVPCGADEGAKRYFSYEDYEAVGSLRLPTKYVDDRGEEASKREFRVAWKLDPELSPALFLRPNVKGE